MSATKFTPGPWTMETVRTSCGVCHKIGPFPAVYGRKESHACIYDDCSIPQAKSGELESNARLIAAAPEMFELLTEALEAIEPATCGLTVKKIEALISKITT